ncbi:MAG: hypothetical protein ACTSVD_03420 [Candidatus Thorarchaeota archaeon]|nr:MAG: hypothetical protein DRO93_01575 [Candidatus Thorarchaeota archaeon]
MERIAEFDPSRKVEVAEELISLARLEAQQQDRRRAMGLIERAVVILKQYIKEWNDDAARELLRDAQQLQSGLRRI